MATFSIPIRHFLFLCSLSTLSQGADYVPQVGPDLKNITVTCGDVTVLFRQRTQWTPGRFDFRASAMTTEKSAYGTVFSFPEIGFIGTGHFENEPEDLKSVSFSMDGKKIKNPGETLKGSTFRFDRDSQIRAFSLQNTIEIKNNRIYETTTFSTKKDAPLTLVYHFMHAWLPTMSAFLAGTDAAPKEDLSGPLIDNKGDARSNHIQKSVDWMAVYEPKSKLFAVSRLLQAPKEAEEKSKIWNVPGTYRKYYNTSFQGKSVPAGFKGTWKMVTGFGSAKPEAWEAAARKLAQDLRPQKK